MFQANMTKVKKNVMFKEFLYPTTLLSDKKILLSQMPFLYRGCQHYKVAEYKTFI